METNFAFIDGQNLYKGIENLGWKIDLQKFRVYLKEKHNVITAYYFIGFIEGNKKFYKMLESFGYTLVFKEVLKLTDGTIKGNVDAELVLQAMKDLDLYNKAIIVSGDGDYGCLAKYLNSINKLKLVIAPNKDDSSILLRRASGGRFASLEEFRNKLEYK